MNTLIFNERVYWSGMHLDDDQAPEPRPAAAAPAPAADPDNGFDRAYYLDERKRLKEEALAILDEIEAEGVTRESGPALWGRYDIVKGKIVSVNNQLEALNA